MTRSEIVELQKDAIKKNFKTDKQGGKKRAYNFTTGVKKVTHFEKSH